MKKLFLSLLIAFNSYGGGGSLPPEKTGNACVSDSFCTYGEMPLQNQGAVTLKWYINDKQKNWNVFDPGWCGAVSGMMALYGVNKHNRKIKWNSWMDDNPENKYGAWKTGLDFKTDFKKGGTYDSNAKAAIENLWNLAKNYKSKYLISESGPMVNSSSVKAEIKALKHVEYLSICKYKIENRRTLAADLFFDKQVIDRKAQVGYYEALKEINGCHALALNGYDGNRLIIHDPWGRVYTADFENIYYGSQSGNYVFGFPKTRVTYGNMKSRTWDNFSHFVEHGGEKGTHTILLNRIKFSIFQP